MDIDNLRNVGASRFAPPPEWPELAERGHLVQFYDEDAFFLDGVTGFLGFGLAAGGGCVAIATKSHLDAIEERLSALGFAMAAAREQGQYVGLDAAETLAQFMEGGWPDDKRFDEAVGGVIARAGRGRQAYVRAFGEMVALLWAEGNQRAAVRLEQLWNELGRRHAFALLCGYPMRGFGVAADAQPFRDICTEHSRVIPAESYAALPDAHERLRIIAGLQQKANALEAEIAARKEVERTLHQRERERADLLARERAARADAEGANRSKDEFLAVLSHELRTPLTAMLGWIRILRTGQLDHGKTVHALDVLERNTEAQARLIDDLLDVSRIISGKLQLDMRSIELNPIVRAALEAVRPAADAKGVRLDASFDPSVGPIAGDADRCQQVVWNLLSNAVRYTPAGGHVELRLDRVETHARITVKDTGSGIAADFLPHVFDRFSQAGRGPTRRHGGLGLGLAIVRHLVLLHGGTVQADSPGEGLGATFTVTLPIARANGDSGRLQAVAPPRERRLDPTLTGVRVLVVDDDGDARDLVVTILEQSGAEVVVTASVPEALDVLGCMIPDVLVSDIGLGTQSGYDLIRAVRKLGGEHGRIQALALTAYARVEDRDLALAAGYQLHVPKPVEPVALAEAVARLSGRPTSTSV